MTGCTPDQLPVLNGLARDFGVFDHWFSEVPSQTFMNRSFWTAATSSGFVVNSPVRKWLERNDAETKVYVMEPMPVSFTGMIHYPRLKHRFATNFVPFAEFERDVAAGTLPDFALIEPNMAAGHGDYHPAMGRSFSDKIDLALDSPSSMLSGEAFLSRVYAAYRSATSEAGPNVWNTALLIGWDEPGGTYDHVFSRDTPRDPSTWAVPQPLPVPPWTLDREELGQGLSSLGKGIASAIIDRCRQLEVDLPAELTDPGAELPPSRIADALRDLAGRFFPLLAGDVKDLT
jgi:phospholipase C